MGAHTKVYSSLGLLVGTVVGAGMFALPYAVVRAGWWWSMLHLVFTFGVLTALHLLYSDVIFATPKKHRLPGYARLYLGSVFGRVSLGSAVIGFYGAMLAYGILGGIFLERILGGVVSAGSLSALFFMCAGAVVAVNLMRVGQIDFILSVALVLFVGVLFLLAFPHADIARIGPGDPGAWFFPYGIFLFAFAGASAIPDAADVFRHNNKKLFRKIVIGGTVIPLAIYLLFIYTVAGVSGTTTSPDAISGLLPYLGSGAVFLGALIGLCAVFRSYISMGADLRNIYRYDYGCDAFVSWLLVVVVPPMLYYLGMNDFLGAIGLAGGVAIGIDGITIVLLTLVLRRKSSNRQNGLGASWLLWIILAALLAGVMRELWFSIFSV